MNHKHSLSHTQNHIQGQVALPLLGIFKLRFLVGPPERESYVGLDAIDGALSSVLPSEKGCGDRRPVCVCDSGGAGLDAKGLIIHRHSSPSVGRRGDGSPARSRTFPAASAERLCPCWTRLCSGQETRKSCGNAR